MIDTILYFLFSICYLTLLILNIKLIKKRNVSFYMVFLPLVIVGLIYDNIIISLGSFIGEGNVLLLLSMFRFWFHALFTPTLLLFAYGVAKQSSLQWANKFIFKIIFLMSTLALISYEIIQTINKNPEILREYGIIRYTFVGASGAPLMVIIMAFILLVVGVSLYRKTRWSIMMIGVALMVVGSAIPINLPSTAIINIFELFFICSLFLTQRYVTFSIHDKD
ncbi:hypothetical protein MMB68_20985 [Priestia sp. Y58]|uniref:hypothetical protein n=1 Tax=Priestia sp. Y58 TaxID=2922804 RepID=UPI002404FB0F|nr:hypothetical protein [Priestia sp. Y58]MDG0032028.1 hypothetical protein [Priestia sp. Y58]